MNGSPNPAPPRNPIRYSPRRVLSLGTVEASWTVKLYAILSDSWTEDSLPSGPAMTAAVSAAMTRLDAPLDHDVGFAILHLADDGVYLLLTRFNNANNLRHLVLSVDLDEQPLRLEPLADPHIVACIWELRLMKFEADAWIEHVLSAGLTRESARRYLAAHFEGAL